MVCDFLKDLFGGDAVDAKIAHVTLYAELKRHTRYACSWQIIRKQLKQAVHTFYKSVEEDTVLRSAPVICWAG